MSRSDDDREIRRENKRARYSDLTGAQVRQALDRMNVTVGRFQRHTGLNESTVHRWLSGKADETLPLWLDLLLYAYWKCPELRTLEDDAPLPFEEWGIEPPSHEDD